MTFNDPNRPTLVGQRRLDGEREDATHVPDLRPFADQLMLIAQHLRDGEFATVPSRPPSKGEAGSASDERSKRHVFAEIARKAYATRRRRTAVFDDPELFGEPAWDILLDLYIALADEKPVSVSSACIGSASPPTTGLRWLGILAEHGLVQREQDPEDQRRVLVRLTDRGAEAMDRYFESIADL